MRKVMKKVARWMETTGIQIGSGVLIVAVVGVGIWFATQMNDESGNPDDFGDASTSDLAQRLSHLSYEDALRLEEEGEMVKCRAVMQRLAPPHLAEKTPRGNGLAHLWMARSYLMSVELVDVTKMVVDIPMGEQKSVERQEIDERLVKISTTHLEAAVHLLGASQEACELQAALSLAQGKRNDAVVSLLDSIEREGSLELGLSVANLLSYRGDELALKEAVWHHFTELGEWVKDEKRGDMGVRASYLVHAMLLEKPEVVVLGLEKFSRDFADQENGRQALRGLKALEAYFKAAASLRSESGVATEVAQHLLNAYEFCPEWRRILQAIDSLVRQKSELKGFVSERLKQRARLMEQGEPKQAAWVKLVLAKWLKEEEGGLVREAFELDDEAPEVIAAWAGMILDEGGEQLNVSALQGVVSEAASAKRLSAEQRFGLLMVQGRLEMVNERWLQALQAFERAVVIEVDEKDQSLAFLHESIGQCYRELNMDLVAKKHFALAAGSGQ